MVSLWLFLFISSLFDPQFFYLVLTSSVFFSQGNSSKFKVIEIKCIGLPSIHVNHICISYNLVWPTKLIELYQMLRAEKIFQFCL